MMPAVFEGPVPRLGGRALPLVGRARMYVCGITPYATTHLGHARTFVWADVAARVLRHAGHEVEVCRNVTDVDDVLTDAARRAGSPYDSFAAVGQFHFENDMAALDVHPVDHQPRAHAHVRAVIALARGLLDLGQAYVRDGAVYFRGAGVPRRLGLDDDLASSLLAEYGDAPAAPGGHDGRDDPYDIAVWLPSGEGEPAWPSPWSHGRPGWHAECTVMALSAFGPALDIHAGGADLRFPHHAYTSAMAEALTGVRPFARTWLQVGIVSKDGAKMAKSTGNLVFVSDLLDSHPASAVRLMLLDRPWAADWDYAPADLDRAAARLDRLHTAAGRPGGSTAGEAAVTAALLNDLDVTTALDIAEHDGGHTTRTTLRALALH